MDPDLRVAVTGTIWAGNVGCAQPAQNLIARSAGRV
jgi:hypothetical protein